MNRFSRTALLAAAVLAFAGVAQAQYFAAPPPPMATGPAQFLQAPDADLVASLAPGPAPDGSPPVQSLPPQRKAMYPDPSTPQTAPPQPGKGQPYAAPPTPGKQNPPYGLPIPPKGQPIAYFGSPQTYGTPQINYGTPQQPPQTYSAPPAAECPPTLCPRQVVYYEAQYSPPASYQADPIPMQKTGFPGGPSSITGKSVKIKHSTNLGDIGASGPVNITATGRGIFGGRVRIKHSSF